MPEFNNTVDMEDPKFELGMLFSSVEAVKNAVKQHSIKHGKQLKLKVERTKVRAKCRGGCKWTLYASVMQGGSTLQVKTLINTCPRSYTNSNVSSRWLDKKYYERFKV